jgi:hypothetical protein
MDNDSKKIVTKLTRVLSLLIIVVLGLIVYIIGFEINKDEKVVNKESLNIDFSSPSIKLNELKDYRRSANFLEEDFNPKVGELVFKQINCASCHSLKDNLIVGPGLKGLFNRVPNKEWLLAFMTEPDSIINLKDSYTVSLREKYFSVKRYHTDQVFDSVYTRQQIYDVLGFIGMKK